MLPDLWVLTVAPGSRRAEAEGLFESLDTPWDRAVVVTNPPDLLTGVKNGTVLTYPEPGINISHWWNVGLDRIAENYAPGEQWDVVIAETDARMRKDDVDTLRTMMRDFGADMAGGDWEHTLEAHVPWYFRVNNESVPVGRIPGIMKVVRGETGIRHDPEYRWWLADDDYEWQHRVAGGTLLVKGIGVQHVGTQGPLTGDRLQYWEEDQIKFFDKWGGMPATNGILPS